MTIRWEKERSEVILLRDIALGQKLIAADIRAKEEAVEHRKVLGRIWPLKYLPCERS